MTTPSDEFLQQLYDEQLPDGEPLNRDGQHDSATPPGFAESNDGIGWSQLVEKNLDKTTG